MSRRAAEAAEPTLRVSQLTDALSTALAVCFPDEVWVQGEISSLRRASSGHVYFELIEPGAPGAPAVAKVAVALFATDKAVVNAILKRVGGVRMTDGLEIRLRGRLAFYGPQGQVQLKMTSIDPAYTLGRLASERERVLAALALEGLLERNAGVALAPRPWRIGLVTSADSAAEADFVHELDQQRPRIPGAGGRRPGAGSRRAAVGDRGLGHAWSGPGSTWWRWCAAVGPAPTWPPSTTWTWPGPSPPARCRC